MVGDQGRNMGDRPVSRAGGQEQREPQDVEARVAQRGRSRHPVSERGFCGNRDCVAPGVAARRPDDEGQQGGRHDEDEHADAHVGAPPADPPNQKLGDLRNDDAADAHAIQRHAQRQSAATIEFHGDGLGVRQGALARSDDADERVDGDEHGRSGGEGANRHQAGGEQEDCDKPYASDAVPIHQPPGDRDRERRQGQSHCKGEGSCATTPAELGDDGLKEDAEGELKNGPLPNDLGAGRSRDNPPRVGAPTRHHSRSPFLMFHVVERLFCFLVH